MLTIKKITKQFGDSLILKDVSFTLKRGERLGVVGSNGVGKTTLLKIILGEEDSDKGVYRIGKRVDIGYLPQDLNFSPDKTLLEEFLSRSPLDESNGRKILNRFGLEEVDVSKKIKDLSPGERSRLILSILMAKKPNCVVLDEPSNHLDLEALTQLESALKGYSGTLIIVSHDRYLLDHISLNNTFVLQENGLLELVNSHSVYEKQIFENL